MSLYARGSAAALTGVSVLMLLRLGYPEAHDLALMAAALLVGLASSAAWGLFDGDTEGEA